jgi:vancomycin permeability regulator SanA
LTWIVILGAAVWRGGAPSPALRRRVAAAVEASRAYPGARFLPTGAVGRHPPSEASVMRDLLVDAGIEPGRIVLEETGRDTLTSLVACARIVRAAGGRVVVCSDAYHVPRCRLVLRALGMASDAAPARGAWRRLGAAGFARAVAREAAATPWDVALALAARLRGDPGARAGVR